MELYNLWGRMSQDIDDTEGALRRFYDSRDCVLGPVVSESMVYTILDDSFTAFKNF